MEGALLELWCDRIDTFRPNDENKRLGLFFFDLEGLTERNPLPFVDSEEETLLVSLNYRHIVVRSTNY